MSTRRAGYLGAENLFAAVTVVLILLVLSGCLGKTAGPGMGRLPVPDASGLLFPEQVAAESVSEEAFQTVFTGSLWLRDGKRYRIFNVVGQAVTLKQMEPGIYFVVMEADNQPIIHKVVRIR